MSFMGAASHKTLVGYSNRFETRICSSAGYAIINDAEYLYLKLKYNFPVYDTGTMSIVVTRKPLAERLSILDELRPPLNVDKL